MTFATVPLTQPVAHSGLDRAGGPSAVELRGATARDIDEIYQLIADHVASDHLLPRTREEIVDEIDSWWVSDLNGEVVGCAALRDFGGGLGELRSLSVVAEAHGRGLGESLVHAVVRQARRQHITRLFAITRNPGYFARHGFTELPMAEVPDVLHADRVPWPRRSGAGHAMELIV